MNVNRMRKYLYKKYKDEGFISVTRGEDHAEDIYHICLERFRQVMLAKHGNQPYEIIIRESNPFSIPTEKFGFHLEYRKLIPKGQEDASRMD